MSVEMEAKDALETLLKRYPGAGICRFGDCAELSADLISRVRDGAKTATCGALMAYLDGDDTLPEAGSIGIVVDWEGTPALVVETTEVSIRLFSEVDADFALAEGEDGDLDGWREGHRTFFARNGGWTNDMALVCERFRLVEDLG